MLIWLFLSVADANLAPFPIEQDNCTVQEQCGGPDLGKSCTYNGLSTVPCPPLAEAGMVYACTDIPQDGSGQFVAVYCDPAPLSPTLESRRCGGQRGLMLLLPFGALFYWRRVGIVRET